MSVVFKTIGFPGELLRVRGGSFRLANIQTASGSRYSGFVRAAGLIQQRWAADMEFATMGKDTSRSWQDFDSFIARLEGQAVLFRLSDPLRALPRGAGAGYAADNPTIAITGATLSGATLVTGATTCLVDEDAPRYARSILMRGLATSATVFLSGDLFELGGNLYMVSGTVLSDAAGLARVPFRWRLHKAAIVGDVVNLHAPAGRFQLFSADEGRVTRRLASLGEAGLAALEVPYV